VAFLEAATTPAARKGRQTWIKKSRASVPIFAGANNLLTAHADAGEATIREGMGWYDGAHSIAADMAETHGLTTKQTAGVLAAFSPQKGWATNIKLAENACAASNTSQIGGHTKNACHKASKILRGQDPLEVLGGRKVRSFYRNIMWPEVMGPVTIDRHMIDLLADKRGFIDEGVLERIGVYQYAAAMVRASAREVGVLPHQMQAICWVHQRKRFDVNFKYDPKPEAS